MTVRVLTMLDTPPEAINLEPAVKEMDNQREILPRTCVTTQQQTNLHRNPKRPVCRGRVRKDVKGDKCIWGRPSEL